MNVGKRLANWNFWSFLVNLLCVLVVLLFATFPGSWVVVPALALPLAVVVVRQRKVIFRRHLRDHGVGGAGRYVIGRYILLAGATVHFSLAGILSPFWVVAVLLAILALEGERLVRSRYQRLRRTAVNLPGAVAEEDRYPYWLVYPLNLVSIAPMLFSALLPGWAVAVALVLEACSLGVVIGALADLVRRNRAGALLEAKLHKVLQRKKPVFYVYWHEKVGSAFQVTMWLPYLDRLGVPYAIVVRTAGNLWELAKLTDRPVILRRTIDDLDDLIVPSVRGVFYVNNSIRNNHMVRYSHLTHIQLLHGESDKAASVNPVMRMYDKDFVAGQAAIDRFAERGIAMPRDMFRIVGRPQVESLRQMAQPIGGIEQKTVLYAPTWHGLQRETDYSSLALGARIVEGLLSSGCTVIFRPHPYSYRSRHFSAMCDGIGHILEVDALRTGRAHVHGDKAERQWGIVDCFNAADAMVTDVSSVVGDFLFSGKPMAMVSMHEAAEDFRQTFPSARAAYVIDGRDPGLAGLDGVLDEMLGADGLSSVRARLKAYYLGTFAEDEYAEAFVGACREELGVLSPV
jgi:hypothetical protein